MSVTIYHNPRCSKSRQALAILTDGGAAPTVVEYLKSPLTADELTALRDLMGVEARAMMRTGEAVYKEQGLADENDEAKLIAAMAAHPILLERPLVTDGKKAAICRPPEKAEAFL